MQGKFEIGDKFLECCWFTGQTIHLEVSSRTETTVSFEESFGEVGCQDECEGCLDSKCGTVTYPIEIENGVERVVYHEYKGAKGYIYAIDPDTKRRRK